MSLALPMKKRLAAVASAALPDVDVFIDRSEAPKAAGGRWVNCYGGSASVRPAVLADDLSGYDLYWELNADIGSGPQQATPEEADATVDAMMRSLLNAVDDDYTLDGLVNSCQWTGLNRKAEWTSDTQQTVVTLVWQAWTRGI